MKPVSLNQLLFHPKSSTLSFFQPPYGVLKDDSEINQFIDDMLSQLKLQGKTPLIKLLDKNRAKVLSLMKSHLDKSHGFFLSDDLQGYVVLDQKVEAYCTIGQTFHVRPLLEELFTNPEYMVVNVSLYDIKIYRGDFQHLEIVEQYEFDQLPKSFFGENNSRLYAPQYLGLIPFKTIMALKTIAQKIADMVLYQAMPVIVTGLEEIKNIFLRYFQNTFGVISHIHEDFYEKTCVEILERCKSFRHMVLDFYSAHLKERLKRLMKSNLLVSDLGEIIKAVYEGEVVHLIIPTEKKIWGRIDPETYEYTIHKRMNKKTSSDILNDLAEAVMKQGGRIQILGPHFFPQDRSVLAILRG